MIANRREFHFLRQSRYHKHYQQTSPHLSSRDSPLLYHIQPSPPTSNNHYSHLSTPKKALPLWLPSTTMISLKRSDLRALATFHLFSHLPSTYIPILTRPPLEEALPKSVQAMVVQHPTTIFQVSNTSQFHWNNYPRPNSLTMMDSNSRLPCLWQSHTMVGCRLPFRQDREHCSMSRARLRRSGFDHVKHS